MWLSADQWCRQAIPQWQTKILGILYKESFNFIKADNYILSLTCLFSAHVSEVGPEITIQLCTKKFSLQST
jgi:hypothetical protein